MTDRWIEHFFSSTRGRIVLLLRRQERTVSDLAEALDVTGNAIRAQLTKLERDELVEPTGKRPGVRKPEIVYGLSKQAETLFPKAYDELLNQLLQVLSERDEDVEDVLREVGRRLADHFSTRVSADTTDERIEQARELIEEIGGVPEVKRANGDAVVMRGKNCPFAAVVSHHSAVCTMTESLLAHLTGLSVRQECSPKGEAPQCRFVFPEAESTNDG